VLPQVYGYPMHQSILLHFNMCVDYKKMMKTMPFEIYIYQGKNFSNEHANILCIKTFFENFFKLIKMKTK
jgi:hypothetical protein